MSEKAHDTRSIPIRIRCKQVLVIYQYEHDVMVTQAEYDSLRFGDGILPDGFWEQVGDPEEILADDERFRPALHRFVREGADSYGMFDVAVQRRRSDGRLCGPVHNAFWTAPAGTSPGDRWMRHKS